jgi:hypothetical protein
VRPGPEDADDDRADDEGQRDRPAADANGAGGFALLVLRDLAVAGLLLEVGVLIAGPLLSLPAAV